MEVGAALVLMQRSFGSEPLPEYTTVTFVGLCLEFLQSWWKICLPFSVSGALKVQIQLSQMLFSN